MRFTDEEKYFVSESFSFIGFASARSDAPARPYIVIKAAEAFKDKGTAKKSPTWLWQTDFTIARSPGWGGTMLSTVLDDFSRFNVAWKLLRDYARRAGYHRHTADLALAASGLDQMNVVHRPRLTPDNGKSYVAEEILPIRLNKAEHRACPRSAVSVTQTQGKIERWHQTLKNQILLEHYASVFRRSRTPGRGPAGNFVEHYNHARYHERPRQSLLRPDFVYFLAGPRSILRTRKDQTPDHRKSSFERHHLHAA